MAKSPGHEKWPDHKVIERAVDERLVITIDGETIADSSDVIKLEEDDHPVRYYFPRSDIQMDKLERTETTSRCPFKGEAHYFTLRAGDQSLADAGWTYEEPYDEHRDLKDRIAFYDDKISGLEITPAP